jgi:hypothetical protein
VLAAAGVAVRGGGARDLHKRSFGLHAECLKGTMEIGRAVRVGARTMNPVRFLGLPLLSRPGTKAPVRDSRCGRRQETESRLTRGRSMSLLTRMSNCSR